MNFFKRKPYYLVYIWLGNEYALIYSGTSYTKAYGYYDYFAWTETKFWTEALKINPPKIRELIK